MDKVKTMPAVKRITRPKATGKPKAKPAADAIVKQLCAEREAFGFLIGNVIGAYLAGLHDYREGKFGPTSRRVAAAVFDMIEATEQQLAELVRRAGSWPHTDTAE